MSAAQNKWSRRRAAVQAEAEADAKAVEQVAIAQEHAALEEKTDEQILADLELPDPDGMEMGDDFSGFMKSAVPERIRKRALRKLWLSNPVLANVDNLVDYGEDFAAEGKLGGVIKTAYQVGKGMLKHVEEMERQEAEEATSIQENIPEEELEPELVAEQDQVEGTESATPEIELPLTLPTEDSASVVAIKRKMRFDFVN